MGLIADATAPDPTQAPTPEAAPQPAPTPEAVVQPAANEHQARMEAGLVSAMDSNNPMLALARKRGERLTNTKGLGNSSFAARASEGAALEYVTPMVTQAAQMEAQDQQQIRGIESQEAMQAKQLTAQEEAQIRGIKSQESIQQTQIEADLKKQMTDIDYKKWWEDVNFEHNALLEGNRQAADSAKDYTSKLGDIYGNKETSTKQKSAAADALKSAYVRNLELLEITSGIDLSKFLGPSAATAAATAAAKASTLAAQSNQTSIRNSRTVYNPYITNPDGLNLYALNARNSPYSNN